jgi:adenylate kinase family enzyme
VETIADFFNRIGQKLTFNGDKRGSDILLPFANSAVDNKQFIPVVRSHPIGLYLMPRNLKNCRLFFATGSPTMQRIVILGNAGSGKSTLAPALGMRLGLPVVHLDTLFWEPDWVEPDAEQFRVRVSVAIAPAAWICEGNYARRTFDLRLPRADLIIWLDTPRLTCFSRVIMRSVMNRPRPDLAAGCTEKIDRAFLTFLHFVWNFDRSYRPGIEAVRLTIGPQIPTVHLRGTRQIAAFLDSLPATPETCLE